MKDVPEINEGNSGVQEGKETTHKYMEAKLRFRKE